MTTIQYRKAPSATNSSAPLSRTRNKIQNGSEAAAEEAAEPVVEDVQSLPVPTGDLRLALTRRAPSTKYLDAIRMERLVKKLVLLKHPAISSGGTGIPRDLFLSEKSDYAADRFRIFASLAVWMINKLGVELKQPRDRDDPNVVVTGIADSLRKLNVSVDTTAHRLKSGSGSDVIVVLYELATACLRSQEEFHTPDFRQLAASENATEEDEDDDVQADEEFESIPFYDWDQEEVADELADDDLNMGGSSNTGLELEVKQRAAEEWRLEADRMTPFFTRPTDGSAGDRLGWSDRIRKLELCRKELDMNVDNVTAKLSGITVEISRSTEKIQNREKYIAVNHRDKVEKFRSASLKLQAAKERYEAHSSEVEANAQKLAEVTEEFEKLKRRVEEKGSSAGDRVAVSNMRAAMKRMKDEIGMYNIKTAMAELRLQELSEMLQNTEMEENSVEMDTLGILPAPKG